MMTGETRSWFERWLHDQPEFKVLVTRAESSELRLAEAVGFLRERDAMMRNDQVGAKDWLRFDARVETWLAAHAPGETKEG